MDIKHEINNNKGRFYIESNNESIAELTYSKAGDNKIILDHTDVNEKFKGKQLGLKLLIAAVENARVKQIKIMPLCPFAKKMFERHTEFSDVLW